MLRHIAGIADLGLFRVIGQPNLEFAVDRKQAARYQINVADVQDAIETAVGGKAVSQVLQGEQTLRPRGALQAPYRRHAGSHPEYPLVGASGERVSLAQLCTVRFAMGHPKSIAREIRATWPSSTACRCATGQHRRRGHEKVKQR